MTLQPRAKNWFVLVTNYQRRDVDFLHQIVNDDRVSYTITSERLNRQGQPELHCVLLLYKRLVYSVVNDLLRSLSPYFLDLIVRPSQYISSFKTLAPYVENGNRFLMQQGGRSDFCDFKDDVLSGFFNLNELMQMHPKIFEHYPRFFERFTGLHLRSRSPS